VTVSLIVCTRNRATALGACLAAIAAIRTCAAWELVVVDNGSTDGTRAVIDAFAAQAAFPVRAVTQPVPGLSNARNAGLAAALGTFVLFTDDDCYVDPGIIDATIAAFADAALGYASGRVRLFDPADYPVTINESCTPLRFAARRFLPAGAVKGANLAFRRCVLDAIGPFDPLFGSGALFPAEDADAAMRASLAGWDGVYDPAIVVWHHHGRKGDDVAALYSSYDLGRGAFHAKLLGLRGGLGPGLRAWAGLPRRALARPALLWGELHGAGWYWWKRLAG
jgi:glycosyltransferase involved in cell wall biosynthesis